MAKVMDVGRMQARQAYRNLWHTDLTSAISADPAFCCLATWCGPCASYILRKRALYDDMTSVCACMQTQHKIEMDKRDGKFGPPLPMAVPPFQTMSRLDQPVPPSVGYPQQGGAYAHGQQQQQQPPYAYPPQAKAEGYPAPGYPQQAYPPPGHPK